MIDFDPNTIPYNTPFHLHNITYTQLKSFLSHNNFHGEGRTHYNSLTNSFITIYPHPNNSTSFTISKT